MSKRILNPRLSRRDTFRLLGAAGATVLAAPKLIGEPAAAQSPACVVTPAQTEGPYFVDEKLNRSDIRVDPSDNSVRQGTPFRLKINVSRIDGGSCSPLTGAQVDIWHCDAAGVYSDFAQEGSAEKKFLRGYQVTDAKGAVEFLTIYPGWYRGRTIHIHFKVRLLAGSNTSYEFTSQLYFNEGISDAILAQAPYNAKGTRDTKNSTDTIFREPANDGAGKTRGELLTVQVTNAPAGEQGYVGTFDIGLKIA